MKIRFPVPARWLALSLVLVLAGTANAQNTFDLDALDNGQLILNLNANEQQNVEQDTLNVSMQYVAQGRDSTVLQNEVNKAMRAARDILEATDNIDWSIQQYHVYTVQPRGTGNSRDISNPAWRAQQGIQMQSLNSEALLVVTARLQAAGLTVNNLYYSLSPAKYQAVADAMLDAALAKLQSRAERVADSLGKGTAQLVEVSIDGNQGFFAPRMMMAEARAMDASAMNVPVAEPGETQVNVMVSARALLGP